MANSAYTSGQVIQVSRLAETIRHAQEDNYPLVLTPVLNMSEILVNRKVVSVIMTFTNKSLTEDAIIQFVENGTGTILDYETLGPNKKAGFKYEDGYSLTIKIRGHVIINVDGDVL